MRMAISELRPKECKRSNKTQNEITFNLMVNSKGIRLRIVIGEGGRFARSIREIYLIEYILKCTSSNGQYIFSTKNDKKRKESLKKKEVQ